MTSPLIDWINTMEGIILKFEVFLLLLMMKFWKITLFKFFECLNIPLAKSDIEDCYRLGKSNPKNTIVRFVNRKNCYATLSKKLDFRHIDQVNLGFPEANLFLNENLTPYNQKLA